MRRRSAALTKLNLAGLIRSAGAETEAGIYTITLPITYSFTYLHTQTAIPRTRMPS